MNPWLVLAALVVAVAVVAVCRAVRPGPGAHRAPQPLLRPMDALDRRAAVCPAEGRLTLHCFLRMGGRVCLDCRTTTPTPTTTTTRGDTDA